MGDILRLEVLIAGLGTGALYASSALCLSLTYRASRVLNLAQGSVALLAAVIVAKLHGLPAPIAAVVGITAAAVIGLAMESTTRNADPLARLTSVTGWLLALTGLLSAKAFVAMSPRFPLGTGTVHVGGVALGLDTLVLILLAAGLPFGLAAFFGRTPAGAAVVAVADAPESARTIGLDVERTRRLVWVGSQGLVGVIGILAAPTIGLQPVTSLILLSGGLAAALLGGLDRLTGPAAVGFALGMTKAMLTSHVTPAVTDAILITVVVVALAVRRQASGSPVESRV